MLYCKQQSHTWRLIKEVFLKRDKFMKKRLTKLKKLRGTKSELLAKMESLKFSGDNNLTCILEVT